MVDTPMVATPMPMVPTTERGPLMPSPRLMLMPTTLEVTVLAMDMVDSMVDTDTGPMVPTPTPMDTTARGPLRPSLRLRLTPPFCTDPTDTPIPMDTMERGLLRPSPRLMLMPTTMELTVLAM